MTKNLWGGRFTGTPDKTFAEFNNSFNFDLRLFDADVRASLAHAAAIRDAGVLSNNEFEKISRGLKKLAENASRDNNFFDGTAAEDVQSFSESTLVDLIGKLGTKIHTDRS